MALVARPRILDAFFFQDQKRLMQGIQTVGGRRVMISTRGCSPVAQQ
jgi:hypothetical protein